jgi:adenylate cyclase
LKPWFRRTAPYLLGLALLLPVCGLLGFVAAGREVSNLISTQPDWLANFLTAAKVPPRSQRQVLYRIDDAVILIFAVSVLLALLARIVRHWSEGRTRIQISYADGQIVRVPRNFSVLEASQLAGIPHASVCGGRGRCSTCRVRVSHGVNELPPPSAAEQRVLHRVGAAPDVRLACQLRPGRDISIAPLLPAGSGATAGFGQPAYLAGQELTIAVMFADLRSFTGISEKKLPYDLVFLLNRYFESVGAPITAAGGMVDKFVGDGVMALFGVDSGAREGCRQALSAAQAMLDQIDRLNKNLAEDLVQPLAIGIGVHCGPAVVGRMGYGRATSVTAIGDTVNVASRLQDLTKEFKCSLVISEEVARQAAVDITALPRHEVTVRNRGEALAVFAVKEPRMLVGKG